MSERSAGPTAAGIALLSEGPEVPGSTFLVHRSREQLSWPGQVGRKGIYHEAVSREEGSNQDRPGQRREVDLRNVLVWPVWFSG